MLIEIEKVEKLKCSSMHYFGTFYCKVLSSKIVLLKKKDMIPFYKINVKNIVEIQYIKEKEYLIMIDTVGRFYKFDLKDNELRRFKRFQEFGFLNTFVIRDDMIIAMCNDTIRRYGIETSEVEKVKSIDLEGMVASKIFYNEKERVYAIMSALYIVILDENFNVIINHRIKNHLSFDIGMYAHKTNKFYYVEKKENINEIEEHIMEYDIVNNHFSSLTKVNKYDFGGDIIALRLLNNEQWLAIINQKYIKIYNFNEMELILSYKLTGAHIPAISLEYDENLNALLFGTVFNCEIIYLKKQ